MTLIERYILRITSGAFLACLLGLTGVIWITQVLRELDLLTSKGQTVMVFLTVTGLSLPALITVIAPVALFIATLYALNRLNSDSELIVMSAAGMRPAGLLRPFLQLALIVSAALAVVTIWLMPASFQELRDLVTRIRADFVANVAREGQFTSLENGITFHYRERSGDALVGIFIQDRREKDKSIVYLAERGQTVEVGGHSYLVLEQGGVQRQESNSQAAAIVQFERYAVDLEAFAPSSGQVVYKPRERSTMQLLFPDKNEEYYKAIEGRFRAELHDRLSAWLYPLAMALIAFAALGDARTTRQGRGLAIAMAVVAVGALRIAGFAASTAAVRSPAAAFLVYLVPLLGIVLPLILILNGSAARQIGRGLSGVAAFNPLRHLPALRRA
jgi:lipopolysaccharide export system permease protein